MSLPWTERPTLLIPGERPAKKRFRDLPADAVLGARELLHTLTAEMPPQLAELDLPAMVRMRTANRFHDEAVALARVIDARWEDLYLANLAYDLTLATIGCSTVALATADGPVLARNMDWPPEALLARTSYLLRTEIGGDLAHVNAGFPGSIGVVSGLSGRGFALALNAVLSGDPPNTEGYPVLLHLRRALEDSTDFNDALARIEHQELTFSALIMLVGTKNQERVVIERTPTRCALRWGNPNEPLVATNNYRELMRPDDRQQPSRTMLDEPGMEIYGSTCARYSALAEFLADHRDDRSVSDDQLLYTLTDERVIQQITAQHIIMRPADRSIRLFVPTKHLV